MVSFGLYGQSRDTISNNIDIEEVVVRGNRSATRTIPAQILDKESLERLSVHSVADAIRYFSGVQIKDYGGIGGLKTVNIRSMGSQHVGVFYDGVELGNAQNGVVDLGRFSLDNMESISMYNGQKSAIFQPAKDFASAGSIYMKSRTPHFDIGKHSNISATFKTGSFGLVNPSLSYEQQLSDKVSSSLSAEYLSSTGKYKFTYSKADGYDTTAVRQNGDVRAIRVDAGLFGRINNGEWRTKLYLYDSERGYPGAYVRSSGEFQNEDRQWDTNIFAQGSMRKGITSNYNILISAKYARDYLHYVSDPSLDTSTMHVDNQYTQQEGYLSVANQFIFSEWWSANLSVDYLYNTLDADLADFVYPQRSTLLGALATSVSFSKFRAQGSLLYTHATDKNRVQSDAEHFDEWSPTLLAAYRPFATENFELRAFYKRIFRMPTLNDLYYVTSSYGSSDLDPEYTNQYNVGATYGVQFGHGALRALELQGDIYYNQVENKIIAMPTSNQFRWTMLNLGYVEIRGVDIAAQAQWQLSEVELNTRVNYTYQKAQDFTDPTDSYYGHQIPYIPWHSGSVVASATLREWELNYSFIYTGERYEAQENIATNYEQPWYTHDMSLFRSFSLGGRAWRAGVEINNLLNQQYEVVRCYPMPGTNVKVTINIKF